MLTWLNQSLGTSQTILSAYRLLMKKFSEPYQTAAFDETTQHPTFLCISLCQLTKTKHSISAKGLNIPLRWTCTTFFFFHFFSL